jgi:hypothetical protein
MLPDRVYFAVSAEPDQELFRRGHVITLLT